MNENVKENKISKKKKKESKLMHYLYATSKSFYLF